MSRAKRKLSLQLPNRKSNMSKKASRKGTTTGCSNSNEGIECAKPKAKSMGQVKSRSSTRNAKTSENDCRRNDCDSSSCLESNSSNDVEKGKVKTTINRMTNETAPQCLGLAHFEASVGCDEKDTIQFSFQPFYRLQKTSTLSDTDLSLSDDDSEKPMYLSRRMSIKVQRCKDGQISPIRARRLVFEDHRPGTSKPAKEVKVSKRRRR